GDVFETLHHDNSLTLIGRTLWVWNFLLGDEMLATTSTELVRCFASRRANQDVTAFLVNKDKVEQATTVNLRDLPKELQHGEQWALHGTGPLDRQPVWERIGPVLVRKSELVLQLEPVSVTVVCLRNESSPGRSTR